MSYENMLGWRWLCGSSYVLAYRDFTFGLVRIRVGLAIEDPDNETTRVCILRSIDVLGGTVEPSCEVKDEKRFPSLAEAIAFDHAVEARRLFRKARDGGLFPLEAAESVDVFSKWIEGTEEIDRRKETRS